MNKETEAERLKRMRLLREEMAAIKRRAEGHDDDDDANYQPDYNSDGSRNDNDDGDFALIRRREKERQSGGSKKKASGASGVQGDFWRCPQCTVANENILVQCLVCNAARPSHAQGGPKLSSFVCEVCTFVNADRSAGQCEMCGTKVSAAPAGAAGPNAGDGESKEDNERRAGAFVLGESAPPPLKRQLLVREHLAFLASVLISLTHFQTPCTAAFRPLSSPNLVSVCFACVCSCASVGWRRRLARFTSRRS